MDDNDRRSNAWASAVDAEGTRVVFSDRAKRLRRKTIVRDFSGIAVPILLAYLLGAEIFPKLQPYKEYIVDALAFAATLQTLMVVWSLLAKWDDERADAIHATRESYLLKEEWRKIGLGDTSDIAIQYSLLSNRQALADSRDVEKLVSPSEQRKGYRAALLEFQRPCACGLVPKTTRPPWRKKLPCPHCGGN